MNLPQGIVAVGNILPNAVRHAVMGNLGKKSWGSMSPAERRLTAEVVVGRAKTLRQVRRAFRRIALPAESVLWVEYDLECLSPEERRVAELFLKSHEWNLVSATGTRVLIRYEGKRH
jgi:hypothetical protein